MASLVIEMLKDVFVNWIALGRAKRGERLEQGKLKIL
jgi:hypothetical protein